MFKCVVFSCVPPPPFFFFKSICLISPISCLCFTICLGQVRLIVLPWIPVTWCLVKWCKTHHPRWSKGALLWTVLSVIFDFYQLQLLECFTQPPFPSSRFRSNENSPSSCLQVPHWDYISSFSWSFSGTGWQELISLFWSLCFWILPKRQIQGSEFSLQKVCFR